LGYFSELWDGIRTTAQGLKLTTSVFGRAVTQGSYTLQYPEETLPIDKVTHRGIHEYDVDRCISCEACAKACPVDCIYIESAPDAKGKPTKGKAAIMTRFDIDYSKCLFCSLCVPPCPSECIQLGERYSLPGHTRDDMVVHFHEGGYPIQVRTELSQEMIREFETEGLFEKKRKEREALGIPTLRPQK
jgi:NADH-quinone oxidoreductase subunit I